MQKIFWVLAVVCFLTGSLMFMGCEGARRESIFYSVDGLVRDVETNLFIYNAWIGFTDTLTPYSFTTDTTGQYEIQFLGAAESIIHIYYGKAGYLTFDTILTLPKTGLHIDGVNIYLSRE